jgi:hypothetical protein
MKKLRLIVINVLVKGLRYNNTIFLFVSHAFIQLDTEVGFI